MIHFVAETGSTSADLAARLRAGEFVPEGDWLVADRQTGGRGRQGREWYDGAGNFMGSTVVQVRFGDPDPTSLALVAGLALWEAVSAVPAKAGTAALPPGAMLKWPNDLMIGTAKLAGILLERVGEAVVVGIGVNLATAPALPDRETVALGGVDRDVFAAELARAFSPIVDEVDPIDSEYFLEVSTPGAERELSEPRHWIRQVGRLARVKLREGTTLSGRVISADEAGVELEVDGETTRIDYAQMKKARARVEFGSEE